MGPLRAVEGAVLLLLRVALGGLFLWAAWVKLENPQAFADSIKGFKVLPPEGDHLVVLATFAVPWVEVLAGAALVLGLWARAAAWVVLLNLAVFVGAIASVLARGISTKCGCFGRLSPFCPETITTCNVWQNAVLAAIAAIVAWRGPGLLGFERRPRSARRADEPGAPLFIVPKDGGQKESGRAPAPGVTRSSAQTPP